MAAITALPAISANPRAPRPKSRQKSLRNVKDSTENLRRRAKRSNFAVSNIGNNGLMYLRPVSRDEPHLLGAGDPIPTIPQLVVSEESQVRGTMDEWRSSAVSRSDTIRSIPDEDYTLPSMTYATSKSHSRNDSHNISTVESSPQLSSSKPQNLKVAVDASLAKTANTGDKRPFDLLDPRPSQDMLDMSRSSRQRSLEPMSSILTDDTGGSSMLSRQEYAELFPVPPGMSHLTVISQDPSQQPVTRMDASPRHVETTKNLDASSWPLTSQNIATTDPSNDPTVLLSESDDPSFVRMSSGTGQIVAASISRLIVQITSPDLLDYVLLSDFFLTFRSFLSKSHLTTRLFERMRWAVSRTDSFGRKVRVRTFVALRHWILNYFADDFVSDFPLRSQFCELANSLGDDLRHRGDGGGGDLKILNELKKCWRSTCSLYWDIPKPRGGDLLNPKILPGGQVGSRHTTDEKAADGHAANDLDSTAMDIETSATEQRDIALSNIQISQQQALDLAHPLPTEKVSVLLSRSSEASTQVFSCSLPNSLPQKPKAATYFGHGPHPVVTGQRDASKVANMPTRPTLNPTRTASFSNARRDNQIPPNAQNLAGSEESEALSHLVPGSLIRGAINPPSNPYVDKIAPLSFPENVADNIVSASLHPDRAETTNAGVKRLFGSVRRALSVKQIDSRDSADISVDRKSRDFAVELHRSAPMAPRRSTSVTRRRKLVGGRSIPRLDMLILEVAKSFERAMPDMQNPNYPDLFSRPTLVRSASQRTSRSAPEPIHLRSQSAVTLGSRSIVIVDGTNMKETTISESEMQNQSRNTRFQFNASDTAAGGYFDPIHAQPTSIGEAVGNPSVQVMRDRRNLSPKQTQSAYIPSGIRVDQIRGLELMPTRSRSLENWPLPPHPILSKENAEVPANEPITDATSEPVPTTEPQLKEQEVGTRTEDDNPSQYVPTAPRSLRRRPGGDLRAVEHVQDLEEISNGYPWSSIVQPPSSEVILDSAVHVPTDTPEVAMTAPTLPPETPYSMLATHSSQPNLRPSFQAEVAKLAELPDDNDDGGIESTLLKLEGRYEKGTPSPTNIEMANPYENVQLSSLDDGPAARIAPSGQLPQQSHNRHEIERVYQRSSAPKPGQDSTSSPGFQSPRPPQSHSQPRAKSPSPSEQSYSSVPLLERGVSNLGHRQKSPSEWFHVLIPARKSSTNAVASQLLKSNDRDHDELGGPAEIIEVSESMRRIPRGGTMPVSMSTKRSFLLNDNESLSDLSDDSTISKGDAQSIDDQLRVGSFYDDEPATPTYEMSIFPHPLRLSSSTPPFLSHFTASNTTTIKKADGRTPHFLHVDPIHRKPGPAGSNKVAPTKSKSDDELRASKPQKSLKSTLSSNHLPFILAYDSVLLAQQFTLVERDALAEIEWRDLIELRWSQIVPTFRDWAQYLSSTSKGKSKAASTPIHQGGVDLIVTRFNLMFRWAVSEVVLTEDVHERALVLSKCIHIAMYCRLLRNWATMCQLTMAITSADCSRLKRTWSLVPGRDREALAELETLILPTRNFHNLRAEIDAAAATPGGEEGSIPFLGIYTHDLIYNAQKPAYIESAAGSGGERLINFERHHTAATIVKTLLALIEASGKYDFKPMPEALTKCIWIAALDDEEIAKRSRALEQ